MENFTPLSALAGGLLIGGSAALLLLYNGRIAGISGILGGLFTLVPGDRLWRVLFLLGLVLAGCTWQWLWPGSFTGRPGYPLPLLISGAFLVGFGTRLGSGCTSGHGVCGIGRLSVRSVVATLVFMGTGVVSVYIIRHLFGVI